MAAALDVSERTVFRTKRRYAEEGLDEVLRHHNQVNRPGKVDERMEAHPVSSTGQALIALACSPDGHDHWTIRALAGKVVELGLVESLGRPSTGGRGERTTNTSGQGRATCSSAASPAGAGATRR